MNKKKIKFRDYKHYPKHILNACYFRDDYDDEPDGAFFVIANEQEIYDDLIEVAEWENENTDLSGNKEEKQ